tara:strand:- start:50 stop:238 length:189 start_codon:yes stop_codon:yes gene_type:complete
MDYLKKFDDYAKGFSSHEGDAKYMALKEMLYDARDEMNGDLLEASVVLNGVQQVIKERFMKK